VLALLQGDIDQKATQDLPMNRWIFLRCFLSGRVLERGRASIASLRFSASAARLATLASVSRYRACASLADPRRALIAVTFEAVVDFDAARRLDPMPLQMHLAAGYGLAGKRPGFEKTRRPQPLIEPYPVLVGDHQALFL
jgi:hypothetical protein